MAEPAKKEHKAGAAVAPEVKQPPVDTGLPKPEGTIVGEPLPKTLPPDFKTDKKFKGSLRPWASEFNSKLYNLPVDDDITLDDLCSPDYWAHVAGELTGGEHFWVTLEGVNPGFVWLQVIEAGHLWAKVVINMNTSHKGAAQEALGLRIAANAQMDFIVEYKGGNSKWCVRRVKDNAALWTGGTSQKAAQDWLDEYKKALRR